MKIIGNKNDINLITLVHKGKDIKFQCFIKPMPYIPRDDLEKDIEAEIIFDDLIEVDQLISVLERFKNESTEYMGNWKIR